MKKGRGELFCGKKGTRPSFFLSRLSLPSRCSTPGVVSLERQRRWTLTVVLQGKVCQEGAAERWKGRWRVGGGGGLEVEFPPPPFFFFPVACASRSLPILPRCSSLQTGSSF